MLFRTTLVDGVGDSTFNEDVTCVFPIMMVWGFDNEEVQQANNDLEIPIMKKNNKPIVMVKSPIMKKNIVFSTVK